MEEKKRLVTIDPQRMGLAESKRNDWVANAPEGATVEDIQDPGFWSLMASQLSPYDNIEVRSDDGTWVAECLVLGCDRTWAKVFVKNTYKLTTGDVALSQSSKYEVQWKGPQRKWIVLRIADQSILKEGCGTKEEAGAWMREHEKTVA